MPLLLNGGSLFPTSELVRPASKTTRTISCAVEPWGDQFLIETYGDIATRWHPSVVYSLHLLLKQSKYTLGMDLKNMICGDPERSNMTLWSYDLPLRFEFCGIFIGGRNRLSIKDTTLIDRGDGNYLCLYLHWRKALRIGIFPTSGWRSISQSITNSTYEGAQV